MTLALPPVARLSLAFSAGAALALLPPGRPLPAALFLLPLLAALIRPFPRPTVIVRLGVVALAGFGSGARADSMAGRCPAEAASASEVIGYMVASPLRGRGTFRVVDGPCAGDVRVLVADAPGPGVPVLIRGRWRDEPMGRALAVQDVTPSNGEPAFLPGAALTRWRGHLTERLAVLYGPRAPMVSALTLARREGLDPGLREAFARSGTAHLLAISGFHVGVIALVLVVGLRRLRLSRRDSALGAALGCWGYVALLGFPDAATRAALILTAVAASRRAGRPPARWGALGSAFLLLVAADPRHLLAPGFQLSFAGAAGLVAWGRGATRWASSFLRLSHGPASAVGAGVAATVATLPVVAWHFERVSLVGIPATLAATPLVVAALPGALASLGADALHPAAGRFLAGGVGLLLGALDRLTRATAAPEWASLWVPRTWVPVAFLAAWGGGSILAPSSGRVVVRRGVGLFAGLAGLVVWPALVGIQARGTLELLAIDVGQGDALALRTPRGRWVLVDAGPARNGDPGGHPVVRALRRAGVVRLEALVLTHPDLDHIGGAAAVLGTFPVGRVVDPGLAAGKEAYVDVLEAAVDRGVPWQAVHAGDRLDLDGVELEVLSPAALGGVEGDTESNAASVVLAVRYGLFDALLTGDAPVEVERAIASEVSASLELLKVGHHGSSTSTDPVLLARSRPRTALLSVGRGNRYGHPAASVLARLREAGVEVHRTDREGSIRVVARQTGEMRVEVERPAVR
ncbi:MAG TPA: DNA internalization-related competence protein ComEC/Rec2 [Longimicrobiales bacterium]|nr:DNA internalization-related competence protein ComEC/Rec2 [Longimicrobiales bacterium]